MWQEAAQKWGSSELGPFSAEWDKKSHFPIDVIKSSAEQGFLGLYCSEDVGGMALSRLDTSIIFEALRTGKEFLTKFIPDFFSFFRILIPEKRTLRFHNRVYVYS